MHKTKKKFKSRRKMEREENRLKLSEEDQKEIKYIEGEIDSVEEKISNTVEEGNDKIRKLKQRVIILDNPHLVKATEMVNFVELKIREAFKDILNDERFKHIDEDELELSVSHGTRGDRLYIDFNMESSMTPEEEEEEVKLPPIWDEEDEEDEEDDDDE